MLTQQTLAQQSVVIQRRSSASSELSSSERLSYIIKYNGQTIETLPVSEISPAEIKRQVVQIWSELENAEMIITPVGVQSARSGASSLKEQRIITFNLPRGTKQ